MVLLGAACLPVMYLLWMLFLALRVDSYGDFADQGQRRDLFDRLGSTSELMSERWSVLQESQAVDVVNRVFVIGFLTDLIRSNRPGASLTGKKLVSDVVTGIPRFLLPSKSEILAKLDAGENTVSVRFGIPVTDQADTVVVSSYADFLWLGLALYPPFVMVLGIFLAWISATIESGFLRMFTVSYALFTALSAEQNLFAGSLNMVRVLVVMLPIFFLLGH